MFLMDETDSPRYCPAAEVRRHWGVFAGLAVALVIWCLVDVAQRAKIDREKPSLHMTDLTVYTEAGAAFFDGREPYEVSNIRGWKYLYPPLFALLMAPLHVFPAPLQASVWFAVSALMACGCYFECRRIFVGSGSHALRRPDFSKQWLFMCALGAAVLPALNCLQRGQMGVALLYFLLLGFRLTLCGETYGQWLLGGLALALPVALKLTPALPAATVSAGLLIGALSARTGNRHGLDFTGRQVSARARFVWSSAGLGAGCVLFLLLIPAALVGWNANLGHLRTWHTKVASRFDDVRAVDFGENVTSLRNQSLQNAAFRGGNWVAHQFLGGPDDWSFDATKGAMPMDSVLASHVVLGVRWLALLTLGVVVMVCALRGDGRSATNAFGLACVATLVFSPVSRGHYFVFWIPAVVSVPLWQLNSGRIRTAWVLAITPAVLTIVHYVALEQAGRAGILGLGTTLWYFAACASICRSAPAVQWGEIAIPLSSAPQFPRAAA